MPGNIHPPLRPDVRSGEFILCWRVNQLIWWWLAIEELEEVVLGAGCLLFMKWPCVLWSWSLWSPEPRHRCGHSRLFQPLASYSHNLDHSPLLSACHDFCSLSRGLDVLYSSLVAPLVQDLWFLLHSNHSSRWLSFGYHCHQEHVTPSNRKCQTATLSATSLPLKSPLHDMRQCDSVPGDRNSPFPSLLNSGWLCTVGSGSGILQVHNHATGTLP